MIYFGGFTQGGGDLLPRRCLTLGYVCRAPVGGFWFGAGRTRPAKGPRAIWFANGKNRAQVSSDAQDDVHGSGCHAGRHTKLGHAPASGHGGWTGFTLDRRMSHAFHGAMLQSAEALP